MDYEVNQPVWHIEINNAVDEKSYRPNGVSIKELKIIGVSPYKICLNNDWFTTLDLIREGDRKNRSIYHYMDNIHTSIRTKDNLLGNGVFISLYSTVKPTKSTLKRMVGHAANKIDKDFGFLLRGATNELHDLIEKYKI